MIDYDNEPPRPMHIEKCQCTPHLPEQLDHHKHILRAGHKASSNKLSPSGCNGPRSGIDTHPQGLKCWTCGETADATDCTEFPYYTRLDQFDGEASGREELYSREYKNLVSAKQTVTMDPNKWSKECLKNDKYCVIQYIVDQYGNNRKLLPIFKVVDFIPLL